jgi:hypothetical protein
LLKAGDLVVTEGNERLMPGTPLILPAPTDVAESEQQPAASPSQ